MRVLLESFHLYVAIEKAPFIFKADVPSIAGYDDNYHSVPLETVLIFHESIQ